MSIGPEIQEDLDRIYPGFEVEKQAEYMFGRDSLSKITRKFPCYRENRQEFTGRSRHIILNIVVNKNGNSEATKVEVSSGDINIDSLAIVYFDSMLKDCFYPAELRGEKVNSNVLIVLPTQCPEQTKIDNGYGTIEERRVIAGRVEPSLSPKNQSSKAALLNNRLTRIENGFDELILSARLMPTLSFGQGNDKALPKEAEAYYLPPDIMPPWCIVSDICVTPLELLN